MKTYKEILDSMVKKYSEIAGFVPDETSDVYIKFQALSGELFAILSSLEWTKRQLFFETASGEYLDRHGESRGIGRKSAKRSSGEVVFSVYEPAVFDMEIPRGTVVSTAGETPLRFETTEDAKIPVGATQVFVPAEAMTPGKASNVRENTVSVIVTTVAGVETVTNPDPFLGGEDTESDQNFRERIRENFKTPSTGANAAYYKEIALSVDGVTGVSVVPKARGVGTVDVYVSTLNGEYETAEFEAAKKMLLEMKEVNTDLQVKEALPKAVNVSFSLELRDGYSFSQVKAACEEAVRDYLCFVGVGGKVILTEMGERIYHTEGVREYLFSSAMKDVVLLNTEYPKAGTITISEGIVR